MWRIELSREAEKSVKKLPAHIVHRTKDALREIALNPHSAKQLKGDLKGQFSYRIGDYRIVYILNDKYKIIYILYVRHRKDAY